MKEEIKKAIQNRIAAQKSELGRLKVERTRLQLDLELNTLLIDEVENSIKVLTNKINLKCQE